MKYSILFLFAAVTGAVNTVQAQDTDQRPMSELRKSTLAMPADHVYFITDPGRQGMFLPDPGDKTTADDSAMTLVTASGMRLKRVVDGRSLNVRWFGASGNGADDWAAIQKGIDYVLNKDNAPRVLFFPAGSYRISRPLLIAKISGAGYRHVSISLEGPANSKDLSTGAAAIVPDFNNSFAIGVQSGKGVLIKDLVIRGRFTFPNRLTAVQIDTLAFREWTDGVTRDNPRSPYAGVVIDPFSDSTKYPTSADMYPGLHRYCLPGLSRSGSTAVQVVGCSITNFIVGVMITPSNQANGELIDVVDCDISDNKVAYAMGQAQSKECHVERLKCWGATHTVFDNMQYGFGHGDGAAVPMVDGVNIAGYAKQLCSIAASSFGGVFRNVYAEGLFRLGFVGGAATLSFEDCQLDFSTLEPGIPYPDFFVLGSGASFHGCMLRHYIDGKGMRLILSGSNNSYEGGLMNEPPVVENLNGCGYCPTSLFRNVIMYYSGGILGSSNGGVTTTAQSPAPANALGPDPVYDGNSYLFTTPGAELFYRYTYHTTYERTALLSGTPVLHVDKTKWTAWFKLASPSDAHLLQKDDFILTTRLHYQDEFTGMEATTYPVGFVESVAHDTVRLRNLAYGIREGMVLTLWMDYYLNEKAAFTGDIAAGSNTLTKVQGYFPAVGERLDMPMLAAGTYVTAVDPGAKTLRFSTSNNSGRSYSDYTFINGYPAVEMHSCYDLPSLLSFHETLIGGATFYLHEVADKHSSREPSYILGGILSARYINFNTHIGGDTSLHKPHFSPPASLPIAQ